MEPDIVSRNIIILVCSFLFKRTELFNAFANSAMCNAGIPILDVFPITASTWKQPEDGIHYEISLLKPVDNVLINYFKDDAEEKR